MPSLFAVTVFVGAALLFTLEPLTGRMLLPLAGGTPAVWTTCMMFFQAALLAGYAYAHAIGERLSLRHQVLIHLAVVMVAVVSLPVGVSPEWFAGSSHPVLTLLPLLVRIIGIPFFALAATAPLMQRWFAAAAPGRDPYPLYAASNTGSLLALAAYPFLLEPGLGLSEQSTVWSAGYGFFLLLLAGCAATAWRSHGSVVVRKSAGKATVDPWQRWLLLSLAPSSLLMSVTTALTTDITPVPLLWVAPLALYLATFIVAFSGRPILPHWFILRAAPIGGLALFYTILSSATSPWWAVLCVHLVAFYLIAQACHGELAKLKPVPERLTRFYLVMSAGGMLGGVFNALLAPLVFRKLGLAEYPLIAGLALMLLPPRPRDPALKNIPEAAGWRAFVYPMAVGVLAAAAILTVRWRSQFVNPTVTGIIFGAALVLLYFVVDRPARFATGLVALWLAGLFHISGDGPALFFERNFFGIVKVGRDPQDGSHVLMHGTTIHGRQIWKDGRGLNEPLSYYGRVGPIGDVFGEIERRAAGAKPPVAVCGLGAGTLAYYAKSEWKPWTFYEIDPAIVRIARDPELFSFLTDNFPADEGLSIVLGDARLEIAKAADGSYGLIVLDAFSSDSIPVHLLTRQAIEMYRDKLQRGGMLAFHVSNRYLDLRPVLAAAARDLKMVARLRKEVASSDEMKLIGRLGSEWIVLARSRDDLGKLVNHPGWEDLKAPQKGFRTWTDDYSNLLSVFDFGNE